MPQLPNLRQWKHQSKLRDELKEIWDIIYPFRTQEIIELDGPIVGVVSCRPLFNALFQ
jgi:hypothetical protein